VAGVHALLTHRAAHGLHELGVPSCRGAVDGLPRADRDRDPPGRRRSARTSSSTTAPASSSARPRRSATTSRSTRASTLGGTGFATGKRHPTLEDNVTVGSGAKLLGPITIGHGAKIGANSVVIHDVPPNSTVVGNPGHPVRVDGVRPEGPDADWVHLPDPVADAIKDLSARIGALERERSGGTEGEVRPLRPVRGPNPPADETPPNVRAPAVCVGLTDVRGLSRRPTAPGGAGGP
jgi:serine O-acetyltransferase